jgi:hypothetical protein
VTAWLGRAAPTLVWLAIAVPALGQLVLLAIAIGARFAYPYDLEWMEGGLLHHAHRISEGEGIYGPPSVDFIPYLYTPLYPATLAVLGSVLGLTYQLGRAISILSLCGIAVVTLAIALGPARGERPAVRAAALGGALLALGLFAASYPYVEGWYDLVRADSLFLLLVTAGIWLAHRSARRGRGWAGQARTAGAAALLALAFFCKQTGVLFVAAGGLVVLIANWRRLASYVAVAGLIGLGGTALLQRATGGWFWTYVYEIHQAHDWNVDRFWMSFGHILWRYPAPTLLVGAGLVVIAVTAVWRRRVPAPARTFAVWSLLFAISTLVGAIGWGTEFAHFNAYMPALLHGAIAAGCALPAIAACLPLLVDPEAGAPAPLVAPVDAADPADRTTPLTVAAAEEVRAPARRRAARLQLAADGLVVAAGVALAGQLIAAWWQPGRFVPRAADRRAGDALIARLRTVEGEVWIPSHPWYAHLAGKRMYVHRMGVKDVTVRKPRPVLGLDEALRLRLFAVIVLANRDLHLHGEAPALRRHYQEEDVLPPGEQPRTVTGARVHPHTWWVPAGPPRRPEGAQVVFDFEDGQPWGAAWKVTGTAWGSRPVERALPRQGPIRRAAGQRWVSSMHGGDATTGTLTSPPFRLEGRRLHLRVGGGTEPSLRVELLVDGAVVRSLSPPPPPSERFRDVVFEIADLHGQTARLRLVDEATGAWGHLNVDEVLLLPE